MIEWILNNKDWLFSGMGVATIGGVWALVRYGYNRWKEGRAAVIETWPSPPRVAATYSSIGRGGNMSRLPPFVLRLLLRPQAVASKIHVDLRGENPIGLSLDSEVPHVDLYFTITNLSRLDLVLDRLMLDVWFGQPTFTAALLRRYPVPAGQITRDIFLRQMLSNAQRAQIEDFLSSEGRRGQIHLYLTAYLDSKIGRIEVQTNMERRKVAQ